MKISILTTDAMRRNWSTKGKSENEVPGLNLYADLILWTLSPLVGRSVCMRHWEHLATSQEKWAPHQIICCSSGAFFDSVLIQDHMATSPAVTVLDSTSDCFFVLMIRSKYWLGQYEHKRSNLSACERHRPSDRSNLFLVQTFDLFALLCAIVYS